MNTFSPIVCNTYTRVNYCTSNRILALGAGGGRRRGGLEAAERRVLEHEVPLARGLQPQAVGSDQVQPALHPPVLPVLGGLRRGRRGLHDGGGLRPSHWPARNFAQLVRFSSPRAGNLLSRRRVFKLPSRRLGSVRLASGGGRWLVGWGLSLLYAFVRLVLFVGCSRIEFGGRTGVVLWVPLWRGSGMIIIVCIGLGA